MKKATKKANATKKTVKKNRVPRITKKVIYAKYGIEYDTKTGKINVPVFGFVKPLLKHGNDKIGNVYAYSQLPREIAFTFTVNGKDYTVCGTCANTCRDAETGEIICYACAGHYQRHNVRASLGINTFLARYCLEFFTRAIMAQIEADKVTVCRIHVAGDFFSMEYLNAWREIANAFPHVVFWTYTKNLEYEAILNAVSNINCVPSIIPGYGFNFGHCEKVITMFYYLKSRGYRVYICKCGFDNTVHCDACKACRTCDYVLFLEHSTSYNAKEDPLYETLEKIVMSQEDIM